MKKTGSCLERIKKQKAETERKNISSGEAVVGFDTAMIGIKTCGAITVAPDETAAPETVKNFVSLARDGFYDGSTFHVKITMEET